MADLRLALRLDALRLPLKKSLDIAARLGVRFVELDGRGEAHPEKLTDTGLRHLRKLLDERNLRVAALRFQTRRGYENTDDLQRRVDATKRAMEFAYKLGTSTVINSIGSIADEKTDSRYETLTSVVRDLGRHGARIGAFLTAETGGEEGAKLAEILDQDDDGFVAVALNPGQLIVNRMNLMDSIRALRSRIQVVCATDGVVDLAAGRGVSVPIGEGTADFPQVFASLDESAFQGTVIVGRHDSTLAELQQGLQYLSNLGHS